MSDEKKDGTAFTAEDLRALRWLAMAAGVVFAGFALVSDGDTGILLTGLALVVAMMVLGPLAVFLARKLRSGRDAPRK